jgi:hypothetical protein
MCCDGAAFADGVGGGVEIRRVRTRVGSTPGSCLEIAVTTSF